MIKYVAAAMIAALPVTASAQQNCNDRSEVISQLNEKYQENQRSIGLASNGAIVETYASDETGTWTIIVTRPDGVSCLVADGRHYQETNIPLPPQGEDG